MSHQLHNDEIRFQCRHILTDGRRCKNPTLRGPRTPENPEGHENFCYFHHTTRRPIENVKARRGRRSAFTLPAACELSERSGIQLAIAQVLQKIASNEIDPRRAGLLLYGLQIAAINLKQDHSHRNHQAAGRPQELPESTATVSEITHHPILGDLAPPAELGQCDDRGPKGSAQRLLEELDTPDGHDVASTPLPTLRAVAEPGHRTEPNPAHLKNLRNKRVRRGSPAPTSAFRTTIAPSPGYTIQIS